MRTILASLALSLAVLGCSDSKQSQSTDTEIRQADKVKVGLIMKSLGNDFFKNMEEGARAHAAKRADLKLIPLGIQNETDVEAQIGLVENLIAQGVSAIVIAPADSRALVPPLARAAKKGIVIVNIDVKLDDAAIADAGITIPFVGPDNAAGARKVGDVLAAKLGKGAKVMILEGNPGADNAAQRKRGFVEAAKAGGLEVASSQTAHWETEEAFQLVTNVLTASPEIKGIMASNDSMALGAVHAVQGLGRGDKVTVVGFDNIEPIRPLICEGKVLATLDQFGAQQAANGIDVALEMVAGKSRSGWVRTPVELITRAELDCS